MSKDPAFLFYPNDYIGGTMGMTFEEKGAYIELLMTQFNRGHMTSQVVGQVVGQIWVKIQDKFKVDSEGLYYNERLDLEIERRKSFVQSRYNNLSGTNQYTKKEGRKVGHMTKHMENENIIVDKGGVGETKKLSIEEVAVNFYKSEVDKAKSFAGKITEEYIKLARHICQKNEDGTFRMSLLLKVKKQLSLNDFSKLYESSKGNIKSITEKIDSFETNISYHKKYNDIYLCINKWMTKDNK